MKDISVIFLVVALVMVTVFTGCATLPGISQCAAEKKTFRDGDFSVDVSVSSKDPGTKKTLLIIPPTGKTNYIDRSYAKQFCRAGYTVYVLNSWIGDEEESTDIEIHQRLYTRAQKAIALVLQQVKTPFVGMIGTSVGALHASISAATIPQVNAVYSIVGGAPIAEVIVTSDQQAMQDLRKARNKQYGFENNQQHKAAISDAFSLEPMEQGDLYRSKSLGMTLADQDETVPYHTQLTLKEYWQPATVITIHSAHFWGIVKMWMFHSGELEGFFESSAKLFGAGK